MANKKSVNSIRKAGVTTAKKVVKKAIVEGNASSAARRQYEKNSNRHNVKGKIKRGR